MKFSVLMAVYKGDQPEFVSDAFSSLVEQTLQPDEVIVVQDGPISSELMDTICEYSKNLNLIHVELEKNGGLGWALMKGVEVAKYEWILRMDADDICSKTRFEEQIRFINKNPDYDCVGGWQEEFNHKPGDLGSFRRVPENNEDILIAMRKFSAVNHVTLALKKSSITRVGSYRGGIGFHEDYDLWNRMIAGGCKFYNIPKVFVHVRVGFGMLGRRGGWSYYKNEVVCHLEAYRLGVVTLPRLIINLVIRFFIRMSPLKVRAFCYKVVRYLINSKSKK